MTYIPEQSGIGGGGGGGVRVGALLFEWNGVDVTQFEATAKRMGASSDGDSTMSIGIADLGGKIGNVIRLTMATTDGGGCFLVEASELTLPARYVIELRHFGRHGASVNDFGGLVPFADASLNINAMLIERFNGSTNLTGTSFSAGVLDDQIGLQSGGSLDPGTILRGGIRQLVTVSRQIGTTPSDFLVGIEERSSSGGREHDSFDRVADHSLLGTDWDGLDLDRFGLGLRLDALNQSGGIDIGGLKVFAHPED